MQDQPTPQEILSAVAAFLRETVVAQTTGHTAFTARVAANAVDLVRRQLDHAAIAEAAEHARLTRLLGREGDLAMLNAALADALADGTLDLTSPGVAAHLNATTREKLAVDQPGYAGLQD